MAHTALAKVALKGLTLLNTRPKHQSEALSDAVRQAGGQVVGFPVLSIVSVDTAAVDLQAFSIFVFTSVNAVSHFFERHAVADFPNAAKVFAIGQATHQALQAECAQITEICIQSPDAQFDSESLLTAPDLQALAGQKVLLIKGEGGRTLIAQTLSKRGAEVQDYVLYSRKPARFCVVNWFQFKLSRTPINVVLATSVESLQSLLNGVEKNAKKDQAWLLLRPLVVFSERIAQFATAQGWQGEILLASPSNESLLATLTRYVERVSAENNI